MLLRHAARCYLAVWLVQGSQIWTGKLFQIVCTVNQPQNRQSWPFIVTAKNRGSNGLVRTENRFRVVWFHWKTGLMVWLARGSVRLKAENHLKMKQSKPRFECFRVVFPISTFDDICSRITTVLSRDSFTWEPKINCCGSLLPDTANSSSNAVASYSAEIWDLRRSLLFWASDRAIFSTTLGKSWNRHPLATGFSASVRSDLKCHRLPPPSLPLSVK